MTNNVQSADLVAFAPAAAVNLIRELPDADNPLANLLRDVGLHKVLMPHSTGIHFDIDTPTDMLVLSINPHIGPHTRRACEELAYDVSHLVKVKHYLSLPYTDVLMSGRIGSPVITQVNTYVRCRLRVFSEERGMKSLGRQQNNLVESLFAHMMEIKGPRAFFEYLSRLVQVAFIDSRVIFAHYKKHLSDNDRFYSDLLLPEEIEDEWARDFTQAVKDAPIPIMIGGHSLIAGGMWSIIDTIRHERGERYSPYKVYMIYPPAELSDATVAGIRAALPETASLYAVTQTKSETTRAHTHINPADDFRLEPHWYIHIADSIPAIKKLEQEGWELRFHARN